MAGHVVYGTYVQENLGNVKSRFLNSYHIVPVMNDSFIFQFLQSKVFKKDQVAQVNPPKFDCQDDMAGLTYLYDACVLWNSVIRYGFYILF